MAEILHFEILRKHGQTNTHTHKQTHKQTDMGITIPRPPPMGGEVTNTQTNRHGHYNTSPSPCGGEVNMSLINLCSCALIGGGGGGGGGGGYFYESSMPVVFFSEKII